jgi:hypothetical protein
MDVFCLCFVTPRGEFVATRVGVSKVEKRGRGSFLLNTQPPAGADVRISALPHGFVARWGRVDQGLAINLFDSKGRPADHGFALVIDRPARSLLEPKKG